MPAVQNSSRPADFRSAMAAAEHGPLVAAAVRAAGRGRWLLRAAAAWRRGAVGGAAPGAGQLVRSGAWVQGGRRAQGSGPVAVRRKQRAHAAPNRRSTALRCVACPSWPVQRLCADAGSIPAPSQGRDDAPWGAQGRIQPAAGDSCPARLSCWWRLAQCGAIETTKISALSERGGAVHAAGAGQPKLLARAGPLWRRAVSCKEWCAPRQSPGSDAAPEGPARERARDCGACCARCAPAASRAAAGPVATLLPQRPAHCFALAGIGPSRMRAHRAARAARLGRCRASAERRLLLRLCQAAGLACSLMQPQLLAPAAGDTAHEMALHTHRLLQGHRRRPCDWPPGADAGVAPVNAGQKQGALCLGEADRSALEDRGCGGAEGGACSQVPKRCLGGGRAASNWRRKAGKPRESTGRLAACWDTHQ